jgi:antitoxin ParD1/3/4
MSELKVGVPETIGAMIDVKVASGEYATASDYVSDLILRDQALAEEDAKWLEALDVSIAQGLADCEAGRVFDLEEVFAELESRYSALAEVEEG